MTTSDIDSWRLKLKTGRMLTLQRHTLSTWAAFLILFSGTSVRASEMREFVLSCTYGTLAGTMVGAATLAFTDKPSENLNKVARGASLGLYAGILLGVYIVYLLPSEGEEEPVEDPDAELGDVGVLAPSKMPRLVMAPILSERGFEGASAQIKLLEF